jgi:hypothetical protein
VTAAFVRYQLITGIESPLSRDSALMIFFVLICPPSLISVVVDTEVGTSNYYVLWTVITLLNGGLYATVRALISRRLQRPH